MKRKICVFTGTRAEYGLLYWLIKEIQADPELELQLLVSGTHLSPEFGLTYKQIEKDGWYINEKVEILLSSDTPVGINKSIGLAFISFGEALDRLKPDILVGLGDRFELFAVAATALVSRIPIAHISGGEATEGAIDESMRHSVSKMANLHFTSTEEYRRRVIQMGEWPDTVFNVGAIGLDNIRRLELLCREDFEQSIDFKLGKRNVLVTFHPVTLETSTAGEQFNELLKALDKLEDTHIIFTKPNADTDGRVIMKQIDEYVSHHQHKAASYTSLGQLRYLSAVQHVDCVVGNSSSGIIEVPSFKKPTINIGDRQKGRIQAPSIISCEPKEDDISKAIAEALSDEFQQKLKTVVNPYDREGTSQHIKQVLSSYPLEGIIKKRFYNIDFKV